MTVSWYRIKITVAALLMARFPPGLSPVLGPDPRSQPIPEDTWTGWVKENLGNLSLQGYGSLSPNSSVDIIQILELAVVLQFVRMTDCSVVRML